MSLLASHLHGVEPSFVAITAATLLGKVPTRVRSVSVSLRLFSQKSMCKVTLHMVMQNLHAAVQPWKPIHDVSDTAFALMLLPQALWNSGVSDATDDRQFLHVYMLQHSLVQLCDFSG